MALLTYDFQDAAQAALQQCPRAVFRLIWETPFVLKLFRASLKPCPTPSLRVGRPTIAQRSMTTSKGLGVRLIAADFSGDRFAECRRVAAEDV